jgi:6-phosphogluconolactonase
MKSIASVVSIIAIGFGLLACSNSGGGGGGGTTDNSTGFVYTANSGDATISMFRVTSGTGALSSVGSPIAAGTQPQQVVLDRTGQFAFVANAGSGDLSSYFINSDGSLSSLGAATAVVSTPRPPTIDPLNRYLFVPSFGSNTLWVFTLNPSGLLTLAGGFPTGSGPQAASLDSQGRFVWVNNVTAGTVSMFFINNPSGTLTPAAGNPLPTGSSPQRVTFRTLGLNLFAFVANAASGTVSVFEVDQTTGGVIAPSPGSPFVAGTTPSAVVIDPSGKFALVANSGSANISVYTINSATGGLAPVQNPAPISNFFPAGTTPQTVAIHPSGNFVYVANAGSNNVTAYTFDQTSGVLTQVAGSPFPAGDTPQRVTIDSAGKFAFVSNKNSDTITVYLIDQTTGALMLVTGSPFPTGSMPGQATTTGTF